MNWVGQGPRPQRVKWDKMEAGSAKTAILILKFGLNCLECSLNPVKSAELPKMAYFYEKWPTSGKFWKNAEAPQKNRHFFSKIFPNAGGFFTNFQNLKSPLANPGIDLIENHYCFQIKRIKIYNSLEISELYVDFSALIKTGQILSISL